MPASIAPSPTLARPASLAILAAAALAASAVLATPLAGQAPASARAHDTARTAGTAAPAGFPETWERVVAEHRRTLEAEGVVGGSVALVRGSGVVAMDHYGMADLETGRPVDDGTLFHWASITKTFTAVAAMQLRDRGLLDLDDPAVAHVPELAAVHDPFGPLDAITLRHLLSHSAGFRAPTWPWGGDEDWHPYEPTGWPQLAAMMPYTRVGFEPGSRYAYSNPGIIFVARAIEAVTGDVYEAHVEKNLLRPLGMTRSYFDATPWHLRAHRSNHYRVVEGRPVAGGPEFDTGITASNGGLNGPVTDMARWVAFLLGARPGDDAAAAGLAGASAHVDAPDPDAILARPSLEEMWRPVVPVGDSPLGPEAMGLSFFLYDHHGHRLLGHTGSQKSFRAFILLDPAAGVGAIGVINTAGGDDSAPDSDRIMSDLRVHIAGELFPLFRGDGRGP